MTIRVDIIVEYGSKRMQLGQIGTEAMRTEYQGTDLAIDMLDKMYKEMRSALVSQAEAAYKRDGE
jgi:hypothetical protein